MRRDLSSIGFAARAYETTGSGRKSSLAAL